MTRRRTSSSAADKVRPRLLFTCEHGGNRIPRQYQHLFAGRRGLLESHRGYDPGALEIGRLLARAHAAPLVYSTTSRLLVELNRSQTHRQLLSAASRVLSEADRERLLERYYYPYRRSVEHHVHQVHEGGYALLHISCHSFTPVLGGEKRNADIGLLYDPHRPRELAFALAWQRALRSLAPELRVRRNYPYRGYDDGLTTFLRRRYPDGHYAGLELEVNQRFPKGPADHWRRMLRVLRDSLAEALEPLEWDCASA